MAKLVSDSFNHLMTKPILIPGVSEIPITCKVLNKIAIKCRGIGNRLRQKKIQVAGSSGNSAFIEAFCYLIKTGKAVRQDYLVGRNSAFCQ